MATTPSETASSAQGAAESSQTNRAAATSTGKLLRRARGFLTLSLLLYGALISLMLFFLPRAAPIAILAMVVLFAGEYVEVTAAPARKVTILVCYIVAVASLIAVDVDPSLKSLALVLGIVPFLVFFGEMLRGTKREKMVTSAALSSLGAVIIACAAMWLLFVTPAAAHFAAITLALALLATLPGIFLTRPGLRVLLGTLLGGLLGYLYTLLPSSFQPGAITAAALPGIANAVSVFNLHWKLAPALGLIIASACVALLVAFTQNAITACTRRENTTTSPTQFSLQVSLGAGLIFVCALPLTLVLIFVAA